MEVGPVCVDEIDASVVAGDVDVSGGVGGESAGERREVGESFGKVRFEEFDKFRSREGGFSE